MADSKDVTDCEPVGIRDGAGARSVTAEKDTIDNRKSREKEALGNALCIATGLMMTGVTIVVPTRAPMVLAMTKGDAAATARRMGLMSSCAAAAELLLNPILGRLSDKYGRKPFLLMAPAVNTFLRMIVAAFPRTMWVMFMERMISGAMIFSFMAPMNAALVDTFGAGQKLAELMARTSSIAGLGAALGPFIGSKLSGARSFFVSGATYMAAALFLACRVPETLTKRRKKEFSWASCSPLSFLRLFQNRMTATLSVLLGLQSLGDYANVYDINFLFLKSALKYGQGKVGNFATGVGISQTVGGETMRCFIRHFGQKGAAFAANMMWILAMCSLGNSRTATQLAVALGLMTFGHARSTPARAYLQKHGQATGMGAAEVQGAQANLLAFLKVWVPMIYGSVYAWATSKGRYIPGLPYFLVGFFTLSAQLVLSSVDPDK